MNLNGANNTIPEYVENIPEDYVEKFDELFEVEEVDIEDYDDEGNLIDIKSWWSVTNRLIPEHSYPLRNKEVAENLCEYLNTVICEYALPENVPEKLDLFLMNGSVKDLGEKINEKRELLKTIHIAKAHELSFELDYLHKCNKIKLNPEEVKAKLELSKNPTEKQINAYCEETYERELQDWKVAKTTVSLLNKQLELLDDMISFEKYVIRKELK